MGRWGCVMGWLLVGLFACDATGLAQGRDHLFVDPLTASLIAANSAGSMRRVVSLSGAPSQLRADLAGRAVIVDASQPRLWFFDGAGVREVALPGAATDAIPDGEGGAYAVIQPTGTSRLLYVRPSGVVMDQALWRRALSVRLRDDGLLVLLLHDPGAFPSIALWHPATGWRNELVLPAVPSALVFDRSGHLWLPGAVPEGIVVVDRRLCVVAVHGVFGPVHALAPHAEGFVAVLGTSPHLVSFGTEFMVAAPLTGPSFALEARSDGGLLLVTTSPLGKGKAAFLSRDLGLLSVTSWAPPFASNDGAGIQHGIAVELERDPDHDGLLTRDELAWGSDPGDGASLPIGCPRGVR